MSKRARRLLPREKRHAAMARLLKAVGSRLDESNISWCLAYGTLLGWHREHDFIAHDDDVDLICFADQKERVYEALYDLQTANRVETTGRYIIVDPETRIQCDIFFFNRSCDVFRHYSLLRHLTCHWQTYLRDDVLPLRRNVLNGIPVWVPAQPETALVKWYGPNYMTPDQ